MAIYLSAAVLTRGLILITDNQKHFPMPEIPRCTLLA
jgi:hypothetical protein